MSTAVSLGVPTPALVTALAFYDGYRSEWLPANLLQVQRDYIGAHTYELLGYVEKLKVFFFVFLTQNAFGI